MILNKESAHLSTLSKNIFTRKSSPTNIYLFKINNGKCEKCLKLTIKTPEQLSTVFIVSFGHIPHLKTFNKYMFARSYPINL